MAPTYSPIIRTESPARPNNPWNSAWSSRTRDWLCGRGGAHRVRPDGARGPDGQRKPFPIGPGYLIDGRPVILTAPRRAAPTAQARTASGSVAVQAKARVALASRIYVEGRHDAELVEQVWGDDLRVEGVVVEYLGGVDDLVGIVEEFRPGPGAPARRPRRPSRGRVEGGPHRRSTAVRRGPGGAHTLVVGHPFIDIWQAVKPAGLGISAWPVIPRGVDWKHGVCQALGWPHASRRTSRGHGSGSGAGCGTGTISSPR